jgi:hypothetical protein
MVRFCRVLEAEQEWIQVLEQSAIEYGLEFHINGSRRQLSFEHYAAKYKLVSGLIMCWGNRNAAVHKDVLGTKFQSYKPRRFLGQTKMAIEQSTISFTDEHIKKVMMEFLKKEEEKTDKRLGKCDYCVGFS